ncbi:MAG: hypothetical protein SXA11_02550 [Cyanobacteriota bacterium]|nr:hypothetical protein [Cyanobacteriota bacterium]
MSDWEFLLQKEGDRSWLPLESTDVEILEGRYRIVARSQFPEAEVQIRVLHESIEEDPPVRRVQTRNARTNKEGLIALVPYTKFKPGLWEISCESAPMSGLLPEANPQAISLQVLPCESDPLDFSGSADESETAVFFATPEENFSQIPDGARGRLPKIENQRISIPKDLPPKPLIKPLPKTEQLPEESETTEPLVEANYIEPQPDEITELIIERNQPSEIEANYIENEIAADVTPVKWQLILERDSYIAKLGDIMLLSGTVTSDSVENPTPLVGGALQICLRNPETSEILAEIEEPLPEQVPPIIFGCTIAIPEKVKTRLVLGQIALTDSTGTIASQSFTITAPLEQWLEALDRNFSEDEHQALPPEATPKQQIIDFPPFLNVGGAIAPAVPGELLEAKLPNSPEPAEAPSLELPAFGNSMPEQLPVDGVNLMELLAQQRPSQEPTADAGEETEIDSLAADLWGSGETADEELEPEAARDETDEVEDFPATVEELGDKMKEPEDSRSDRLSSPLVPSFQSGKSDNRFLSRLNSMVGDSELLEWMKIDLSETPAETAPVETEPGALEAAEATDETSSNEARGEIDWEAMEVVVDDEPSPPAALPGASQGLSGGNLARLTGRGELVRASDRSDSSDEMPGYILPPEEPVPVPVVEVLASEVIAGRRVQVRVLLPDLLPRIYVKLWISDRQTQTIVDHPRWVTDFSLNGFDQLEATVEMKVPFGCLEVRFEAIAREMQTNRESHKTSIDRLVVPPPPPTLPLEE